MDEVKLLPCVTKASLQFADGSMVAIDFERGNSIDEALSKLRLASTGEARPPIVTDEAVERVALGGFQAGVDKWMDACFTPAIKADVQERCDRFVEESLEFVQAAGYSAERAHALVDYTFGRPTGEINQEVGGVMVTLAAMCNTVGVDIGAAAETELSRVWTKIDVIRAKQATKPTGSALPSAAMPTIDQDGGELRGKRPRIPTPEMIAAAWAVIERDKKATGVAKLGPGLGVREIWQAMYDAASEPPAQPENDQCQD